MQVKRIFTTKSDKLHLQVGLTTGEIQEFFLGYKFTTFLGEPRLHVGTFKD